MDFGKAWVMTIFYNIFYKLKVKNYIGLEFFIQ